MITRYPGKGESIYKLNPVLNAHQEFVTVGEIKMRYVALFTDKVDSPFRHKHDRQELVMVVSKSIPEMWDGKLIKPEYLKMLDNKDAAVNKAIVLYDSLFNPTIVKKIKRRIESLHILSDAQEEVLRYSKKEVGDDLLKYQAESSKLIKEGILRKTTEEIEYYENKLSEHIVLPIEFMSRVDGHKEEADKTNSASDTADDIDVSKIERD